MSIFNLFDFRTPAQKEVDCIREMDSGHINTKICPTCERSYCWIRWTGDDKYKLKYGCKLGEKK